MNVPHDDKGGSSNVELGTTEIRIDEQGNLLTDDQLKRSAAVPPAEPMPAAVTPVSPPAEPVRTHAFMGSTAQPPAPDTPFGTATDQPDWAAPYEMVPMDPMKDNNSTSPPAVPTPVASPLDNARNAVQTAYGAASASQESAPLPLPLPAVPPAPASDTPILHLPVDGPAPAMAAPASPLAPPPLTAQDAAAPPPMPPPLMAAPGAVVPNPYNPSQKS